MMESILYFPRGVEVKITPRSEVTDEFRQQIRNSFRDYTAGTAEEYRIQDKLAYIDWIRELNFKVNATDFVNEFIRYQLEEEGEVTKDALASFENLENFINEGICRYRKGWHHLTGDYHLDEPICNFVAAAIEEVINYPSMDTPRKES